MNWQHFFNSLAILLWITGIAGAAQSEDPREELKGIWVAESIESAGDKAPEKVVALMRFSFKEKQLLVRGNFSDDREETCDYKLDTSMCPKHIQIQPPKEKDAVLGIYRIVDGKLEICFQKASKDYPTEFKSTKDNKYVLVKFNRVEQKK